MSTTSTNVSFGGGFASLLGVALIVLKLIGVIDWSWWWVLAPIWMPTAFVLVIVLIILIVMALFYGISIATKPKRR